ncbi:unnamed protein product [Paramecium primaurelia]|uniref:tRNA-2-methylthio-N(6)-dimethylallyladenosine synthase n=1 Tax=Paramecium primaurelia TaxID=5886 RepID=A0A8S1NWX1_PARPR|nr:unnamed protein product [Paramecium primaurelia]
MLRQLIQSFQKPHFSSYKRGLNDIPSLSEFMKQQVPIINNTNKGPKFFIETYGCQMNTNDSQIVQSILSNEGYSNTNDISEADIIFLNTCSIRANAEKKVFQRMSELKSQNKVLGILGCMAERLKEQLFTQGANIIVGPDSYKSLPTLLDSFQLNRDKQIDTNLSQTETYDDILPINPTDSITTYVSIMRGCNNMCSFCVVPFTRGRERSRNPESILKEIDVLTQKGVKEVTLLGQNVNSYFFQDEKIQSQHENSAGFTELYKLRYGNGLRFDQLLNEIAVRFPKTRIRFTSPHPKNFPKKVLEVIAKHPNICKNIHIPIQSGSNDILQKMRRNYTRRAIEDLCKDIRNQIPNVTLSTDVIVGFCDETEQDFEQTLSLLELIQFENAFMFAYSMREKTHAQRNFQDNVPESVKQNRLERLIELQHKIMNQKNSLEVGKNHIVLVEQLGNRPNQLRGRTDTNKTVVFENEKNIYSTGDFVEVQIISSGLKTLSGRPLNKCQINFN